MARGWYPGTDAGTRHVSIPLGKSKRMSRCLVTCTTDEQADERAGVVREIARVLMASGNAAELDRWVRSACEGDDAKALAVLGYAQQLAAGKVATKATIGPIGKTFAQVAHMWTSGELTKLYPDQVPEKRTADLDVTRLDVLSKIVGAIPVARFTVDDAERAMRSLPSKLRPATRRQYAQALRRVLELAAYPLRLIPSNPLPRLFLPKGRHDLELQVLYPDEEAKLMACEAVPLAYRMTYGFLARMGFRKSEAIGDPETDAEPLRWRALDLDRGVVRVARSKTEKPRPVPLDAGVCEALAAWKDTRKPGDDEAVFAGVKLANAETFREHLRAAGVDRAELYTRSKDSLPIRVHDLRATFVTVSMAIGKPDTWIRDRTAHKTVSMLDRYRRAARNFEELNTGELAPLIDAIPGLRVDSASMAPKKQTPKPKPTPRNSSQFQRVDSNHDKRNQKPQRVSCTEHDGSDSSRETHGDAGPPIATPEPIDGPSTLRGSLERALELAVAAGRWDVVTQLAKELEARREATAR